jgi:hypothetical protein
MKRRPHGWRFSVLVTVGVTAAATALTGAAVAPAGSAGQSAHAGTAAVKPAAPSAHWCNTNGITCAEPFQKWENFPFFSKLRKQHVNIGEYIGHDEPSTLFYSNKPGSGNDNTYQIRLPKDPPVKPRQDQSGGTWNFQLHPTFWLGMAMCDDQSAPNPAYSGAVYPTNHCKPDSDKNIYTSDTASDSHYIGKHPGMAFMEMQFYPPGWVKWPVGNSCDANRWCAALNIDSLSENMNTGVPNNNACLNSAGLEPVNFAFLTKNGVATTSADPLNDARFNPSPSKDFFMRNGDRLSVHMSDTPKGFTVVVHDITSGTTGEMVASKANGFASVAFDPSASSCSVIKHAFHPAYSTSSPDTRVTWAAHSYNVAFSDEIGHFEFCNKVDTASATLNCAEGGGFDTKNTDPQDDNYCIPAPGVAGTESSKIQVTGCLGIFGDSDLDFDGVSYDARVWPGSLANQTVSRLMTSTPLRFTSPTTRGGANYSRVAFEADLPRIEDFRPDSPFGGVQQNCQRFVQNPADPNPGQGCVNPPPQSRDYPFYVTTSSARGCQWAEVGGVHLPGVIRAFGGSSATEFGQTLLAGDYPASPAGTVTIRYNNFRRVLSTNPCRA